MNDAQCGNYDTFRDRFGYSHVHHKVEGLRRGHLHLLLPADGVAADFGDHDLERVVRAVLKELGKLEQDCETFDVGAIEKDKRGVGDAGQNVIVQHNKIVGVILLRKLNHE